MFPVRAPGLLLQLADTPCCVQESQLMFPLMLLPEPKAMGIRANSKQL